MKAKLLLLIVSGMLNLMVFAQSDTIKTEDLLDMSFEQLLNMDVTTASKSEEKQSDAPGIISVLTKDELERFGGATLLDILNRVPGLINSGTGFTDPNTIASRGDQVKGNSGHVLLLINGRPAREILEGGVSSEMYSRFPVNIIEKIEVIKGPGSVLYGSDAFSAVINVITETAEKTGFTVDGAVINGGGYQYSGKISAKFGDLGIVASGRYLQNPEWAGTYTSLNRFTGETTDTTVNVPDKGTGTYVGVDFKGLHIMSSYTQWTTYTYTGGMLDWKKLFGNLGYEFKVNDFWNMDINATYTHAGCEFQNISSRRSSYNLVTEWTNFINISDKSKLVVGGLFNQNSGDEVLTIPEVTVSKGSKNSFAFYAQLDYKLFESLKFIGGLQANKVDSIKMNVVPRLGLIWYPVPQLNIKALYSEAFRAPSINENNINFINNGQPTLRGDQGLTPEKVMTVDFEISYQLEQAQVGISYFWSKQSDIIQYFSNTGALPLVYTNMGKIELEGLEFGGKYYINKNFYVNASLLKMLNKPDTTNFLTPIADFGAKAGISYSSEKGITVGLFDIFQGKPDKHYAGLISIDQLSYNLLSLHTKFNLNKLLNMKFKPALSVYVDVNNMLDEKYNIYDGNSIVYPRPIGLGRTIYFGVNVLL